MLSTFSDIYQCCISRAISCIRVPSLVQKCSDPIQVAIQSSLPYSPLKVHFSQRLGTRWWFGWTITYFWALYMWTRSVHYDMTEMLCVAWATEHYSHKLPHVFSSSPSFKVPQITGNLLWTHGRQKLSFLSTFALTSCPSWRHVCLLWDSSCKTS